MEDKLYEKLEKEMKDLKQHFKDKGVNYAIDNAYEIIVKQEIMDGIKYDNLLSRIQIKALLSKENILSLLYDDWLKFDGNMREYINYSVENSVKNITNDYLKNHNNRKRNEQYEELN